MAKRSGAIILLVFACVALPVAAADKGKDPSKRLQQQLNMAQKEKARLAEEKAAVDAQLKEAQDKLAASEKSADTAAKRGARLAKELETTRAELGGKLAEAERQSQEQKQAFEAERRRLQQAMQVLQTLSNQQLTALTGCRERNDRMYKLGNEVLDRYEQKNCWTAAMQAEPFTGLKRAQIEKMVEEDREKLDKDLLIPEPARAIVVPAPPIPDGQNAAGVFMGSGVPPKADEVLKMEGRVQ